MDNSPHESDDVKRTRPDAGQRVPNSPKANSRRPRQRLRRFDWDDMGGGMIWELADENGEHVAEVSAEEDSNLWNWSVVVPEWYRRGGVSPLGRVRSLDDAKRVCEAILLGTVLDA